MMHLRLGFGLAACVLAVADMHVSGVEPGAAPVLAHLAFDVRPTSCKTNGVAYWSDTRPAYCYLERRQKSELDLLSRQYPELAPLKNPINTFAQCIEVMTLVARRWEGDSASESAVRKILDDFCGKNEKSWQDERYLTTRYEDPVLIGVLGPTFNRVVNEAANLSLLSSTDVAIGTLPAPFTSMETVAVPSAEPLADVIIVDSDYSSLSINMAMLLLPLLDVVRAAPGKQRDEVPGVLERNPYAKAVFREGLLKHVQPTGSRLSGGFPFVARDRNLAHRSEAFSRALATFGIAHEFVHVARGHHRRARSTCERWAEELEADFLGQQILDKIVASGKPVAGMALGPEHRPASLVSIALTQMLTEAYLEADQLHDWAPPSPEAFQRVFDVVQIQIATRSMQEAATKFAEFGCSASSIPYPPHWMRKVALMRGMFASGVEGDSIKDIGIVPMLEQLWRGVREEVRLAVKNSGAQNRTRSQVHYAGDSANNGRQPGTGTRPGHNAIRLRISERNSFLSRSASGQSVSGTLERLGDRAENRFAYVLEQNVTPMNSPGRGWSRDFRLLSVSENAQLALSTFAGVPAFAQFLLRNGDIVERSYSDDLHKAISPGAIERIDHALSTLSMVVPLQLLLKNARWSNFRVDEVRGRRTVRHGEIRLLPREGCAFEFDTKADTPEGPAEPEAPEAPKVAQQIATARGAVELDCETLAIKNGRYEEKRTWLRKDLSAHVTTRFTIESSVHVDSVVLPSGTP
jgi:hypothetical protein